MFRWLKNAQWLDISFKVSGAQEVTRDRRCYFTASAACFVSVNC